MKRIGYLDVLRVLSSILVVCGHASALCWNDIAVNTSKWQIMSVYDCAGVVGVPLFFMISGAIFLNSEYQISTKKLLINKVLHIFIIYNIWLLLYNIFPFLYGDIEVSAGNIKDMIYKVLTGSGAYHLWFLPQLMALYLISPILKKAFSDKKTCEYYLVLYLVVGGLLQSALLFDFPYKVFLQSIYDRSSFVMLTGYIGYFVMGHYINVFLPDTIDRKIKIWLRMAAIISFVIVVVVCGVDAVIKNQPQGILNTPYTLSHVVICFCVFWLIKARVSETDKPVTGYCQMLSKYTMGVYLIHPFFMDILSRLGVSTLYPHTLIMVPVIIALLYVTSVLATWLISLVPGVRRLLT